MDVCVWVCDELGLGMRLINPPNCCMALSALQGSSKVTCTLLFWFLTLRSACKEMPELAASEMMATC